MFDRSVLGLGRHVVHCNAAAALPGAVAVVVAGDDDDAIAAAVAEAVRDNRLSVVINDCSNLVCCWTFIDPIAPRSP